MKNEKINRARIFINFPKCVKNRSENYHFLGTFFNIFRKCNGSLKFDTIAAVKWLREQTFKHDRRIKYAERKIEELDNRVTDLERKVEVIVSNYLN